MNFGYQQPRLPVGPQLLLSNNHWTLAEHTAFLQRLRDFPDSYYDKAGTIWSMMFTSLNFFISTIGRKNKSEREIEQYAYQAFIANFEKGSWNEPHITYWNYNDYNLLVIKSRRLGWHDTMTNPEKEQQSTFVTLLHQQLQQQQQQLQYPLLYHQQFQSPQQVQLPLQQQQQHQPDHQQVPYNQLLPQQEQQQQQQVLQQYQQQHQQHLYNQIKRQQYQQQFQQRQQFMRLGDSSNTSSNNTRSDGTVRDNNDNAIDHPNQQQQQQRVVELGQQELQLHQPEHRQVEEGHNLQQIGTSHYRSNTNTNKEEEVIHLVDSMNSKSGGAGDNTNAADDANHADDDADDNTDGKITENPKNSVRLDDSSIEMIHPDEQTIADDDETMVTAAVAAGNSSSSGDDSFKTAVEEITTNDDRGMDENDSIDVDGDDDNQKGEARRHSRSSCGNNGRAIDRNEHVNNNSTNERSLLSYVINPPKAKEVIDLVDSNSSSDDDDDGGGGDNNDANEDIKEEVGNHNDDDNNNNTRAESNIDTIHNGGAEETKDSITIDDGHENENEDNDNDVSNESPQEQPVKTRGGTSVVIIAAAAALCVDVDMYDTNSSTDNDEGNTSSNNNATNEDSYDGKEAGNNNMRMKPNIEMINNDGAAEEKKDNTVIDDGHDDDGNKDNDDINGRGIDAAAVSCVGGDYIADINGGNKDDDDALVDSIKGAVRTNGDDDVDAIIEEAGNYVNSNGNENKTSFINDDDEDDSTLPVVNATNTTTTEVIDLVDVDNSSDDNDDNDIGGDVVCGNLEEKRMITHKENSSRSLDASDDVDIDRENLMDDDDDGIDSGNRCDNIEEENMISWKEDVSNRLDENDSDSNNIGVCNKSMNRHENFSRNRLVNKAASRTTIVTTINTGERDSPTLLPTELDANPMLYETGNSPYEINSRFCAETGEIDLDELKELMEPSAVNNNRMNPKFGLLFGDGIGDEIFKARIEIVNQTRNHDRLFEPDWKLGKIDNIVLFGWITKSQLLMCLPEEQFMIDTNTTTTENYGCKATTIQSIVFELDCYGLTMNAIEEWDLKYEFRKLASNNVGKESLTFLGETDQILNCWKCQIFIARVYVTFEILKKKKNEIQPSLMRKMKAYLNIMDKHVQPNVRELKRIIEESEKKKKKKKRSSSSNEKTTIETLKNSNSKETHKHSMASSERARNANANDDNKDDVNTGTSITTIPNNAATASSNGRRRGPWSKEEHKQFVIALQASQNEHCTNEEHRIMAQYFDWIANEYVPTRNREAIRCYYSRYKKDKQKRSTSKNKKTISSPSPKKRPPSSTDSVAAVAKRTSLPPPPNIDNSTIKKKHLPRAGLKTTGLSDEEQDDTNVKNNVVIPTMTTHRSLRRSRGAWEDNDGVATTSLSSTPHNNKNNSQPIQTRNNNSKKTMKSPPFASGSSSKQIIPRKTVTDPNAYPISASSTKKRNRHAPATATEAAIFPTDSTKKRLKQRFNDGMINHPGDEEEKDTETTTKENKSKTSSVRNSNTVVKKKMKKRRSPANHNDDDKQKKRHKKQEKKKSKRSHRRVHRHHPDAGVTPAEEEKDAHNDDANNGVCNDRNRDSDSNTNRRRYTNPTIEGTVDERWDQLVTGFDCLKNYLYRMQNQLDYVGTHMENGFEKFNQEVRENVLRGLERTKEQKQKQKLGQQQQEEEQAEEQQLDPQQQKNGQQYDPQQEKKDELLQHDEEPIQQQQKQQ